MGNLLRGTFNRYRRLAQRPLRSRALMIERIGGRSGLEIGGPSEFFRREELLPAYRVCGRLDNCDFAARTTWTAHEEQFVFDPQRPPGRNFFLDGADLQSIPDSSYDFVLSCHNLEHFANPVRALREWRRVAVPGLTLVLVLPDGRYTFDRRRAPTPVRHMLEDYEQGTPESDLTHLPDVLANHDLSSDPGAGSREEFERRCRANFENRCLHHHVFRVGNARRLLEAVNMRLLAAETAWPFHIVMLAEMT
jgi:SAM-dependent methyltransferase